MQMGSSLSFPLAMILSWASADFFFLEARSNEWPFAHAVVSDPCILLLEEATSALDMQSEGIMQNALDKAAAGMIPVHNT